MKQTVRVGTRESRLAVAQSLWVTERIRKAHPELEFELVYIKTEGDAVLDKALDKIGGKGLFVKELERALLDGKIDLAVHSLKDMPYDLPEGLTVAALSEREDPRDVLVSRDGTVLEKLPEGAIIGTSSLRREVQLKGMRPDFKTRVLRGNVLTRLQKLYAGEYDAVVLAAAGLKRLGRLDAVSQYFAVDEMIPAAGQGILAVEAREDCDSGFLKDSVHSAGSHAESAAERAFMARLGAGCYTPVAAHAVLDGEGIKLYGMYSEGVDSEVCMDFIAGKKGDAEKLGRELADRLLKKIYKRTR